MRFAGPGTYCADEAGAEKPHFVIAPREWTNQRKVFMGDIAPTHPPQRPAPASAPALVPSPSPAPSPPIAQHGRRRTKARERG